MINMLHPIEENAQKLQADILRIQGLNSLISDSDLELLARRSQRLAIRCRELWASYREICYPSIEVTPTQGGATSYLHDWSIIVHADDLVEISLPLLLPKRTCPDTAFVTEPLECLLSAYPGNLPRFLRCYVLFRHIYGSELTVRDIRDHDNIESRKALNTIERYLLTSDSGYYCTTIHQTAQGGNAKTIILLAGSHNYLEGVLRDEATQ